MQRIWIDLDCLYDQILVVEQSRHYKCVEMASEKMVKTVILEAPIQHAAMEVHAFSSMEPSASMCFSFQ